jgi:hypothetical protein
MLWIYSCSVAFRDESIYTSSSLFPSHSVSMSRFVIDENQISEEMGDEI